MLFCVLDGIKIEGQLDKKYVRTKRQACAEYVGEKRQSKAGAFMAPC